MWGFWGTFFRGTYVSCCVYRVPSISLFSAKSSGVFWEHAFSFGKAESTVVLDRLLGDMESVGSCKVEMHHLVLKEELLNNTKFQECRILPNVKAVLAQFPKAGDIYRALLLLGLCYEQPYKTGPVILVHFINNFLYRFYLLRLYCQI